MSSALLPAGVARSRLKARITGSSSPRSVLPATSTGRFERDAEEAQHALGPAPGNGRALQRVELEAAGDDDLAPGRRRAPSGGAPPPRPARRSGHVGEHAAEERARPAGSARTTAARCGR